MSDVLIESPGIVIIDTHPLLLLLVGGYDKRSIKKFKRLKPLDEKDFELVNLFLQRAKCVITTPGVLAEVSAFAHQFKECDFLEFVKRNLLLLKKLEEQYVPKELLLNDFDKIKFGFTDASIIEAARSKNGKVLTNDYPLFSYCNRTGITAVHLDALKERFV